MNKVLGYLIRKIDTEGRIMNKLLCVLFVRFTEKNKNLNLVVDTYCGRLLYGTIVR
jgi:hypothetical protein